MLREGGAMSRFAVQAEQTWGTTCYVGGRSQVTLDVNRRLPAPANHAGWFDQQFR
jgi:hypothetical protein